MSTAETMEGYLIRSGIEYDLVDEGLYVLHDDVEGVDNIAIHVMDPVVVFTVRLMDVPEDAEARCALYERLLSLNASDLVSGAYAIEAGSVIMTETLQAENLDYNEFQAAVDTLTLAITEHYQELKKFHTAANAANA